MFNEEKKLAWMADAERRDALADRRGATSHLNRLAEAVEIPLNEDIFDIMRGGRKSEAIALGNQSFGFTTYATVRRFINTVNAYIDWRFAIDAAAIPTADERFSPREFSLIETFRGKDYIATEDELRSALSHKRIEDGALIAVFASLAWCGYSPKDMITIRQNEVDDTGNNIVLQGKTIPSGFVNDTLLYYSRTTHYLKGVYQIRCIKEDGPLFLRNIVFENNPRETANMLTKIKNTAPKITLLNGGTISYQQLKQAGEFQQFIAMERAGFMVSEEWIQTTKKFTALKARERMKEFQEFKIALGV